jgi:hypothetical protein
MLPAHWFGRDKGLPGRLLKPSGGPEEANAKEKEVNAACLAVQTHGLLLGRAPRNVCHLLVGTLQHR